MPKFALRFPYFIIMLCLLVSLVGAVNIAQMPVDLVSRYRHARRRRGHVL
jgi:multidrug efflux pump subunit AcrB